MIVTKAEVKQLERVIGEAPFIDYLLEHPHVLLACGFDEMRQAILDDSPLRRMIVHCYRQTSTGIWWYRSPWIFSRTPIAGFRMVMEMVDGDTKFDLNDDDLLGHCKNALQVDGRFSAIVLPSLWLPPQKHPRIELVDATRSILLALHEGGATFDSITWPQLEDIVAELLRAQGLSVTVTSRSRDGGRDILARGELIPGEPTSLAVEVKHKGLVRLDEVRSRIHANKEFPALLFATSGRFSAGVVHEKNRPDNFLRLTLKNGVALSHWIANYHTKRTGERPPNPPQPTGSAGG